MIHLEPTAEKTKKVPFSIMVRGYSMDYDDLCVGNTDQLHTIRNDAHKKAKTMKSIGRVAVPACLLAINAIAFQMNTRADTNHATVTALRDTLNIATLTVSGILYGRYRQQRKVAHDFDQALMMVHGNDTHVLYDKTCTELVEKGLFTKENNDGVILYKPTYLVP